MKTFVFIPTKYPTELTTNLIISASTDPSVTKVFIFNNGDTEISGSGNIEVLDTKNLTIYQMWNHAIEYIKYNYPKRKTNIAILNDDIELFPNTLSILSDYLRKVPDLGIISPDPNGSIWNAPDKANWVITYTNTTAGAGGITGYCFMFRGELSVKIDENLKLYWGDDDLVKQIISLGYGAAYLKGLPIYHVGSATIKKMDSKERYNIMEADRAYFNQKYNERREPAW